MTYASGGLIEATDYNSFSASVNALWGTGSSDRGFGQATTLSSVSAASDVTATQWSSLISRINSIRTHSDATSSGLTSPAAGDTISFLSTLSSQISTADTNRLSNTGSGNAADSLGGTKTVSNATGFTTTRTLAISITFSSYDQMRYFFNTGGFVTISAEASTHSGNTKSTDWDNLCNAFGTTKVLAQTCAKVGGSGTLSVNNSSVGFYDLTATNQVLLRQFSPTGTGGYNSNFITSFARLNVIHASSPTQIILTMTWQDDAADTFDDTISGTARIDCTAQAAGVTYISNTWGAQVAAVVTSA